jgi:hypothetical protein
MCDEGRSGSMLMLKSAGSPIRRYSATVGAALLIACGQQVGQQAGWGPAAAISGTSTIADACAPEVAMDARGSAIVVWRASQVAADVLMAARQAPDGTWQEPVSVDTPVGALAAYQHVAMDATGNAVATWVRQASFPTVWASRFSPAIGWTPPERLTPAGEQGWFPQLAVDPMGHGLAVWRSTRLNFPPIDWTIWASRLAQGQWEPAQAIQSPRLETGGSAGVAVSADGTALAVWAELQGGIPRIWANRFRPQTGWATAEPISDEDPRGVSFADVAMDAMGDGTAVSLHWVASAVQDIVAIRYIAGRGWDAPVTAAARRNSVQSPQLAMDPSGNALVVWHEAGPGDVFRLWTTRFTIGAGWGQPVLLQDEVGTVEPARIAMDAEGNGTAVWRRVKADRLDIYAARFNFDGGWGTPEIIGSSPRAGTILSGVGPVVVAMSPGGDAVACWSQQESGHHVIRASRFDHGAIPP